MIKFLDGPATEIVLSLRRAPVLLRVVLSREAKWDALDQLEDEPKPSEQIFVYRRVGDFTRYHLLVRGKGKRASGFYCSAEYRFVPLQPADEDVRSTERWRAWCQMVKDDEKVPVAAGGGLES